jgi:hypothetical protein
MCTKAPAVFFLAVPKQKAMSYFDTNRIRKSIMNNRRALIAAGAIIMVSGVLGVLRFSAAPLFSKADNRSVTYEDVRASIEQAGVSSGDPRIDDIRAQLALIDPTLNEEKVLGAVSDQILNYPKAEEIFPQSLLETIAIHKIDANDKASLELYATKILFTESNVDALAIYGGLNSTDPTALADATQQATQMVTELSSIEVPKPLWEYHRLKMMYYKTLANFGDIFSGITAEAEVENQGPILFSLTDRLERIRTEIANTYGVNL